MVSGVFDDEAGVEASDLTPDEIDRLRPEVYTHPAKQAEETLFMKVHDACTSNDKNIPLFPEEASAGAIHIIRNPLDVVVSFADHSGLNYDTAISRMAEESFEELQHQEKEGGFKEKSPASKMFFRKSEAGSWREGLTEKQAKYVKGC